MNLRNRIQIVRNGLRSNRALLRLRSDEHQNARASKWSALAALFLWFVFTVCAAVPEPEFIGWTGNPWTEAQMAEAKRRQPDVKRFWRPLLETPEDTARKMADPTADFNAQPELG